MSLLLCLATAQIAQGLTFERPLDSGAIDLTTTSISGNTITVGPATTIWVDRRSVWEYWWMSFKMSDVDTSTVYQFQIDAPLLFGSDGYTVASYQNSTRLVYSYDGVNWERFDNGAVDYLAYYTFSNNTPFSSSTVYVALDIPYTTAMTAAHTASLVSSPWVSPTKRSNANLVFNRTIGGIDQYGRDVPRQDMFAYKITNPAISEPKSKIVITTGTHSAEHVATHVFQGVVDFLTGDSYEAALLRNYVEVYAYPQIDPDGRYAGYSRANQEHLGDINRSWLFTLPYSKAYSNLDKIKTTMIVDTGGDVDIFIDFHGQREQKNTIYATPEMREGDYITALMRSGSFTESGGKGDPNRSRGWAEMYLNAEVSVTAETGWMTCLTTEEFNALGETYGLAMYDSLVTDKTGYELTVVSGSGSSLYNAGDVVAIAPDAAPTSMVFNGWSGDIAGVANTAALCTTYTMPAADARVTATYASDTVFHTLSVISGRGSSTYNAGDVVAIEADLPASGLEFDFWDGDIDGISDANAASTTIIMPAADATITAIYRAVYGLTVTSGSGTGSYEEGQTVDIEAAPLVGRTVFFQWAGDTDGVDDVYAFNTMVTMPADDVTLRALYKYRGDLDENGVVDIADLNMILIDWDKSGAALRYPRSDADGNGTVNIVDLSIVLDDWGKTSF